MAHANGKAGFSVGLTLCGREECINWMIVDQ